jgi:hypothetical protein
MDVHEHPTSICMVTSTSCMQRRYIPVRVHAMVNFKHCSACAHIFSAEELQTQVKLMDQFETDNARTPRGGIREESASPSKPIRKRAMEASASSFSAAALGD